MLTLIGMIKYFFTAFLALSSYFSYSQSDGIGIGTSSVDATAVLEIESTTKGLLIPRLTDGQMNTINNPADGLTIYNLSQDAFLVYDGDLGSWRKLVAMQPNGSVDMESGRITRLANGTSATDAVNRAQLDTKITSGNGTVIRSYIANDAINSDKIANNAVGADQIAASAVGSSEIANNAVGSSEIASDAVTASKIAVGAIVASGTYRIGDHAGGRENHTITFSPTVSLENSNYMVLITWVTTDYRNSDGSARNTPWTDDVANYIVYNKRATSFSIQTSEFGGGQSRGFGFDWAIMKL